jgi:hypothetical protein
MAFALTGFKARSYSVGSPSEVKAIQQVVLNITGLAADVDLDIGDATGTFWTDAEADSTYGTLATNALAVLTTIEGQSAALVDVQSAELLDRVQVASLTTTGQYTLAIGDIGPNIEFNAADGEETYKIILVWELNDGILPITASYGA